MFVFMFSFIESCAIQMILSQWRHTEEHCKYNLSIHYNDVIMGAIVIVFSIVYSGADQRKHRSSASLALVRGIHRGPVYSPHKWPITRKMFPFDDVIMSLWTLDINTRKKHSNAVYIKHAINAGYMITGQFVLKCIVDYAKPCGGYALSKVPKHAYLKDKRGLSGFVLTRVFLQELSPAPLHIIAFCIPNFSN